MALKDLEITKDIVFTYKALVKSWRYLILNTGIEFLFFIAISIATTIVQTRMAEHLYQLLQLVGESTGGILNSLQDPTMPTIVGLSNNPTFQFHFNQVLIHLSILFIVVFIIWVLLQGTTWWISHKIAEKKKLAFTSYLMAFFLESALFFLIFGMSVFFFLKSYINVGLSISSVISLLQLKIGYVIFLLLLLYFASLSYSSRSPDAKDNIKAAFIKGTKGFLHLLPMLAVLLLSFFVVLPYVWTLILTHMGKWISFLFGLVVFLPAFTFARVLFIRTFSRLPKDL